MMNDCLWIIGKKIKLNRQKCLISIKYDYGRGKASLGNIYYFMVQFDLGWEQL